MTRQPSRRASVLILALAFFSMALFLGLVLLRVPFPLERRISYQDVLDLLTPLVLLPVYWLILRHTATPGPGRGIGLAFVVLSAVWAMGHGLHLSANSIANLIASRGPPTGSVTDIADLTHLWDEVLSHYLWHAGVVGLAVLLVLAEWRSPTRVQVAWVPTAVAGVVYGVTLFSIFLEGQTLPLGMPFVASTTVACAFWGRRAIRERPVLAFVASSCAVALLLLAGWGLYWGGFPQFSDVGLI